MLLKHKAFLSNHGLVATAARVRPRLYTAFPEDLVLPWGHGGQRKGLTMTAQKAALPIILMAIGLCSVSHSSRADDANAAANAQRIQATFAAQSMLGYPPVAAVVSTYCCCPSGLGPRHAYGILSQQIAALSAALEQVPKPPTHSPAALAEGAY